MYAFIDTAISRSRTTLSIMVLILLAGFISFVNLPVEADPDVQVPILIITVPHEGISPEDAERLLIMPLEVELRDVDNVEEVRAYGAEGSATVVVEFDVNADPQEGLTDTREAVDRAKAKMPTTIEEPIISEVSASDFPIAVVNVTGEKVPERVLYGVARRLQDDLEGIPAVLEARLAGDREEVLEALIDPIELESYGLTSNELFTAIADNNRLIAAGALNTGEGRFAVKVPSLIENHDDLVGLPLRQDGSAVVTLDQVAEIRRTFKDRTSYAKAQGFRTISLEVTKRPGVSIVSVMEDVEALLDRVRKDVPASVQILVNQNQAPMAIKQVNELLGNITTALALVMTLVVAALGLRSGLLVGAAIPASFLFSMILLNYIDYTFNFMVMFGMLLALGMLIDGAIVVTEYADRKLVEGHSREDAFRMAAKRMFWPVVASTTTTLAAFLPLFFWPGVSGKFMLYLPVTVFCVLVGSLLYALVFGPTLGALFGKAQRPRPRDLEQMRLLEDGDPRELTGITGFYARLLYAVSSAPILMTVLTVAVLLVSFKLYSDHGKGVEFFTDADPNYANINIMARGNLGPDESFRLVREVEQIVLDVPGIEDIYMATAVSGGSSIRGNGAAPPDQIGQIFIKVHEAEHRTHTGYEILEQIRERTAGLAGIRIEVNKMEQGPPTGKDVQLELSSTNGALLEPAVREIRAYFESQPDLRDIQDTLSLPGIQWELRVDRERAAQLGVSVPMVGFAVQLITNGVKVGEYRPNDAEEEVDIRVRYPREDRGLSALETMTVPNRSGEQIPLESFVALVPAQRVDMVERNNGVRVEYVRANTIPGVLADDAVRKVDEWMRSRNLDPRINYRFRGASEEQEEAGAFLGVAFMLALLVMYILLVTQFNNFYQAGLILFAVVMSTAGVLLGLVLTGRPFSVILTGTGIVALAGIVVNNNIVLIDTFNELRERAPDLSIRVLIARTGAQRLRPVFLTTVTTIFGLLPIAFHVSIDFMSRTIEHGGSTTAFWVPLCQGVVAGLTFATLLTLVATPAMLALPERLDEIFGAAWRNLRGPLHRLRSAAPAGATRTDL